MLRLWRPAGHGEPDLENKGLVQLTSVSSRSSRIFNLPRCPAACPTACGASCPASSVA